MLESFLIKLPAFRHAALLEIDSNTGVFLLGNFLSKFSLKNLSELTLGKDCLELCFWTVAFKTVLTQ